MEILYKSWLVKLEINQLPRLSGRWVPGIPRASTAASQPLDRKTVPMAGKSPQPSHEPPFQAPSHRHTVTLMKQWKEEK